MLRKVLVRCKDRNVSFNLMLKRNIAVIFEILLFLFFSVCISSSLISTDQNSHRFLHNNRISHLVPGTFSHLQAMKRL